MYDEAEIFICDCSDVSHQIVFQLWDFGKDGKLWKPAESNCELSVAVPLNGYLSFWGRIRLAIKYIFGYKCKFGHYDTMNIRYEDVPRMKALLDKFASRVDEYRKQVQEGENNV